MRDFKQRIQKFRLPLLFALVVFFVMLATIAIIAAGTIFFSRIGLLNRSEYSQMPLLLLALISVIIGTALAALISRKPLEPLREIMTAVDRVADGTGLICQMTTKELKSLHFNKTHPEYEKATIPTLREVFELLCPTGLRINVELKNSRILYEKLEEKVIRLAEETGMTDRVLYSSFNHYSMMHIKEIDPSIPCGLLYDAMLHEPWKYAKNLKADAIHPHFSELQIPGEAEAAHVLQGVLLGFAQIAHQRPRGADCRRMLLQPQGRQRGQAEVFLQNLLRLPGLKPCGGLL